MSNITWPIIIVVGSSQQSVKWYAAELDKPINEIQLLANVVTNYFSGYFIDLSSPGASNSRHIRRAILECISQRKLNPNQRIILLLELSFDLRKEIWIDDSPNKDTFDSNFYQIQLASDNDWWENQKKNLVDDDANNTEKIMKHHSTYFKKWLESQRYFYSSYAEIIKLYQDILALSCLLRQHQIDYIIFKGNPVEKFKTTAVTQILKESLDNDQNILDLEEFSFTKWCLDHQYLPVENNLAKNELIYGHPTVEAHREFANKIILPILNRKQI